MKKDERERRGRSKKEKKHVGIRDVEGGGGVDRRGEDGGVGRRGGG